MFEKDYLMRQLTALLEALQRIIRRRREGNFTLALEEIRMFYAMLKIDEITVDMTVSELYYWLTDTKKLTNDQIEMLAYVMKEQGEMDANDDKRMDYFRKAHFLLEKVELETITFSVERLMKIGELKEYLKGEGGG